jgi:hypothetical protein
MDTRKIRKAMPTDFSTVEGKAKTLRQAADDGFELIPGEKRPDIAGIPMILVAWEFRPGIRGEYATIWAYLKNEDASVRPIKFQAGGSGIISIPQQLRDMQDNGVTGDVLSVLHAEPYSFVDDDGVSIDAVRYWLEDPEEANPDF